MHSLLFVRPGERERFEAKVAKGGEDACWEWTAYRTGPGYGQFGVNGKVRGVHRVAWANHHGRDIPHGLFICHTCDNPPCCNPAHLFPGTHADNMADMVSKGRQDSSNVRRGKDQGLAKLTDDNVREIRSLLAQGVRQKVIAKQFGIAQSTVSCINTGKTWTHVA